eukprot:NODE_316_length_1052_cov_62.966102_g254_i0.p6 GENE.NODE_316_length_1052_cov_62.966102_g254_i0~~NODE_316_length_1052_cov_62.966102_g254_i0.p6  ORF type:complete len:50 (+),score=17.80 NODE_316_length_1052_cov_62.966102_g254_i0:887-1036(+)
MLNCRWFKIHKNQENVDFPVAGRFFFFFFFFFCDYKRFWAVQMQLYEST